MAIPKHLKLLLLLLCITINFTSAVNFLFNGFNSSDVSLIGNATVESTILTLTKDTNFSIGRAFYPSKIPTRQPNTSLAHHFSTSFIFAIAPYKDKLPGHGLVFVFVPHQGTLGSSSQFLGLFNFTSNGDSSNHIFGVEFDSFMNAEFGDINNNHVGIDATSLQSIKAHVAGYWPDDYRKKEDGSPDESSFKNLGLNNGKPYQVWIDYADYVVNVTMAPVGMKRPKLSLLSVRLDLSRILEDEMYVGFTASTGRLIQSHKILAWSFSNTNFTLSEGLIGKGLPSFELPKTPIHKTRGFIIGLILGSLVFANVCVIVVLLFVLAGKIKTML